MNGSEPLRRGILSSSGRCRKLWIPVDLDSLMNTYLTISTTYMVNLDQYLF